MLGEQELQDITADERRYADQFLVTTRRVLASCIIWSKVVEHQTPGLV